MIKIPFAQVVREVRSCYVGKLILKPFGRLLPTSCLSLVERLALLLALVPGWFARQANVPMRVCLLCPCGIKHNVRVYAV